MLKDKCGHMLHPEQGVSLIELMVGLLVGLLVVAAVGGVYVSTTRSSADILAANRLNQEIRALTELMNFEIRRPDPASMRARNRSQSMTAAVASSIAISSTAANAMPVFASMRARSN